MNYQDEILKDEELMALFDKALIEELILDSYPDATDEQIDHICSIVSDPKDAALMYNLIFITLPY